MIKSHEDTVQNLENPGYCTPETSLGRLGLWDPMAHLMIDQDHVSDQWSTTKVLDPYGVGPIWPTIQLIQITGGGRLVE